VARLFENTLFEKWRSSGQPAHRLGGRGRDADVIGSAGGVGPGRCQVAAIRAALDQFSRERLIKNLLQTSPLFVPFTKSQQASCFVASRATRSRPVPN